MKKLIPSIIVTIIAIIVVFNFGKTNDIEKELDKSSKLVSTKTTETTNSKDIEETTRKFKIEKMESRIASMSADNKELKAIEYRYFLKSKDYIAPEHYKDYQFDVINTPLQNPYSIQQIKFSSEEAEGYIYELLISTVYSSAYSDEKLKELENDPGFQLVLVGVDNQSIIY